MHRDIRWIAIGALSFVAVVVTGACGWDNGDSDGGDTTQSGSMTVKMLDSVFEPDHLTVKAGTTMKFELPMEVQEADIDGLGHANNTVFVRWIQDVAVAHSVAVGFHRLGYPRSSARNSSSICSRLAQPMCCGCRVMWK